MAKNSAATGCVVIFIIWFVLATASMMFFFPREDHMSRQDYTLRREDQAPKTIQNLEQLQKVSAKDEAMPQPGAATGDPLSGTKGGQNLTHPGSVPKISKTKPDASGTTISPAKAMKDMKAKVATKLGLNGTPTHGYPEEQEHYVLGGNVQEGLQEHGMMSMLCQKFGGGFGNFMDFGGTHTLFMSKCLKHFGKVISIAALPNCGPNIAAQLKTSIVASKLGNVALYQYEVGNGTTQNIVKTLGPDNETASTVSVNKQQDSDNHRNVTGPVTTLDKLLENEPAMKSLMAARLTIEDSEGNILHKELIGAEVLMTNYSPCYLQIDLKQRPWRERLLRMLSISGYDTGYAHNVDGPVVLQQRSMVACVKRVAASSQPVAAAQSSSQPSQPAKAATTTSHSNHSHQPQQAQEPQQPNATAASAATSLTKNASTSPQSSSSATYKPIITMHLHVLTIPNSSKAAVRLERFTERTTKLGFVGTHAIQPIYGVDSSRFYPNHDGLEALMKWGNWSNETAHHYKLIANQKIFENFTSMMREESMTSPVYPDKYINASEGRLHPGQIAVALGHRHFWMKTATLPDNAWSVLFEDDAAPLDTPSELTALLREIQMTMDKMEPEKRAQQPEIVYLGACKPGRTFWGDFFRDAVAYAIKPSMARQLLMKAPGDEPVDWAIKKVAHRGMCANFTLKDASHLVSLLGKV